MYGGQNYHIYFKFFILFYSLRLMGIKTYDTPRSTKNIYFILFALTFGFNLKVQGLLGIKKNSFVIFFVPQQVLGGVIASKFDHIHFVWPPFKVQLC
jgi:hypothetical protein